MGRCAPEGSKLCWKRKDECFAKGHRIPKAQASRPARLGPEGRCAFLKAKSSRGGLFACATPFAALSQAAGLQGQLTGAGAGMGSWASLASKLSEGAKPEAALHLAHRSLALQAPSSRAIM